MLHLVRQAHLGVSIVVGFAGRLGALYLEGRIGLDLGLPLIAIEHNDAGGGHFDLLLQYWPIPGQGGRNRGVLLAQLAFDSKLLLNQWWIGTRVEVSALATLLHESLQLLLILEQPARLGVACDKAGTFGRVVRFHDVQSDWTLGDKVVIRLRTDARHHSASHHVPPVLEYALHGHRRLVRGLVRHARRLVLRSITLEQLQGRLGTHDRCILKVDRWLLLLQME